MRDMLESDDEKAAEEGPPEQKSKSKSKSPAPKKKGENIFGKKPPMFPPAKDEQPRQERSAKSNRKRRNKDKGQESPDAKP